MATKTLSSNSTNSETIYITVFNKAGKQIGTFANSNSTQDNSKKKNMLGNPMLHIVTNGECTLTFEMLKTSKKWQTLKDPENRWHCEGRVFVMLQEGSVQYTGELVKVTLHEEWKLLDREYLQVHNVDTNIEALDVHTVKILPKTTSEFKLTVNGVSYDDSSVVDMQGTVLPRGSAGYALWGIIKGNRTGWCIGICDVIVDGFNANIDYGTFNLESDKTNLLENILHVQELWGGILVFDSLNKYIHLRDETKVNSDFNKWTGFAAQKGKNLLSVPQVQVDNNIITKAYPLGNGDIHIKEVNNDKLYIENYSYTTDVYEGYIYNTNIHYTGDADLSGPTQLKAWAERELAKLCKPRKTYVFSLVDLSTRQEYSHEKFKINDVIKLYFDDSDSGEETVIEQRIIDIQMNVWTRECSVIIGDKILNSREIYALTYKNATNPYTTTDWNGMYNSDNVRVNFYDDYASGLFGGQNSASLTEVTRLFSQTTTETTDAIAEVYVYTNENFAKTESLTSFEAQTAENFSQSNTRITQVSNALNAQITLEASHYQASLNYTTNSVASLRTYVDGSFSQATLSAAYSYTDRETGKVESSLATFEAYASRTYATATMLAQTNSSLASVRITANDAAADVTVVARKLGDIDNTYGFMQVTSNVARMGITTQAYIGVVSGNCYVSSNSGNVYISSASGLISLSGSVSIGSTGKSVNIRGNVYINGKLQ